MLLAVRKVPVAIETLIVFQVSYYQLLAMSQVDIGLYGMVTWGKYLNGINLVLGSSFSFCPAAFSISFYCNIFYNLNIMVYIQTFCVLCYLLLLAYIQLRKRQVDKAKQELH